MTEGPPQISPEQQRLRALYKDFLARAPVRQIVRVEGDRLVLECGHDQCVWTCSPLRPAVRCRQCWEALW